MQGGPTSAGDIRPPNLIEVTCLPDIQQTTGGGSIPTDLIETHSPDNLEPQVSSQANGRRAASLLLVTHVLEISAMVAATLLRFIPQASKPLSTSQAATTSGTSSTLLDSNAHGETTTILLSVHISFLIIPLMIVTAVSLAWVLRVQDFSGKIVARLVCWILHFLQSSLVWRYLKLQIAYDPGDLAELGMLRSIQLYIHTLPFLVMHIAITLSLQRTLGFTLSLSVALFVSVVATIIISNTVRQNSQTSSLSPPTIVQICYSSKYVKNGEYISIGDDSKIRVVVSVTTMCVVWSRVISMAALFCLHAVWAIGLVILHWLVAVIWLGFQEEIAPNILNSSRQIIRRIFLGYLLLWDLHVFGDDSSTSMVCSSSKLPVIYYTIVASQNIAVTSAWYVTKRFNGLSSFYTVILASVIFSQVVALILLTLSYMCYNSLLPKWPPKKSSSLTISRKPSLVTSMRKASSSDLNPKLNGNNDIPTVLESPPYLDFQDFIEGEVTVISEVSKSFDQSGEKLESQTSLTPDHRHKKDEKDIAYPHSITPKLLSNHLPSSMYSFSNDILQHTSKSERSSTDNGSFNSRNTNTLPPSGTLLPEYEILHRPYGSFSDSFSSLSCGTVSKVITSTPKSSLNNQLYPHNVKRLKHMKSCQNSCCHGKVLDRMTHKCAEVEEEQDETVIQEENTKEQSSFDYIENGDSPPRVTVVRATQRFQVVCSKCLDAHDPLLTHCRIQSRSNGPPSLSYSCGGELGGYGGGSSTDYPSDTELTTTIDTLSSLSADSHSTYTTWPVGRGQGLAKLLMREKGGHDYVTAWLRHQQARSSAIPPSSTPNPQDNQKRAYRANQLSQNRHNHSRYIKPPRRHGQKARLRSPPAFVQDLETVV